jgi:CarD family transcriptional regulator
MFLIGEGVFYPLFGAGYVINIEEKEIYGVSKKYYMIKLIINNILVMIPVDSEDSKRLRCIMKSCEYDSIINILKGNYNILPSKWCDRFKIYNSSIREGDIYRLTELVRDIHNLPRRKEISKSDIKMFYDILSLISSEICIATNIDFETVKSNLLEILKK